MRGLVRRRASANGVQAPPGPAPMAQVDLSALSGPELRRLLDTTRARGDAALSYQILQEMAARRDAPKPRGLLAMRRPAEPRMIALNLGDPLEPEDELPPLPAWRPPPPEPAAAAARPPEPEPPPAPPPRRSRRRKTAAPVAVVDVEPPPPPPSEPRGPRSVWDADPEPPADEAADATDESLRLHAPALESRGAPGRRRRGLGMGFAAGIAVGIALGFVAGGMMREGPPPAAPAAAPLQTAALQPQPAPVVAPAVPEPEPAPEAPPELAEAPLPSPDAQDVAEVAAGEAMELPASPAPEAAPADACAAAPTPADRQICGDPELRRLQRELRQAYAQALAAHEDRALLRQRQLAWASARDAVSDPARLARLYEQRIRRLNAATEAARRERPS